MNERLSSWLRRLSGSWLAPGAVFTAWVVWAYQRTYPRGSAVRGGVLLHSYGLWSIRRFAYSDVLLLYRVHHLANHAAPYVHTAIEYPVLTGLFMWTAAWFHGVQGYFLASSVGLGLCGLGTVWLLHRAAPWAAWAFALNPMLLFYALLNWDLLGIFLMVAAWTAWRANRNVASGALFAAAVWAKLFPGVLFVYCAIDSWRRRRELGVSGIVRLLSAAAVTTLVINLPFALLNLKGWTHFFKMNATRRGGDGLLFRLHIVSHWSHGAADVLIAVIVFAGMALLAGYVARHGGAEFAAAAAFAWWMLFNKVFSPQYMLWVLIYAVIAGWSSLMVALISAAGLADFSSSFITLYLSKTHSRAYGWWMYRAFYQERAFRLSAIAIALAVSLWGVLVARKKGSGLTIAPSEVAGSGGASPPAGVP
ncbi:MAG: glycosyltransferase 87 family protein [Acidimicrobiales bacterium]|jgi:uncharacterized membrane protein